MKKLLKTIRFLTLVTFILTSILSCSNLMGKKSAKESETAKKDAAYITLSVADIGRNINPVIDVNALNNLELKGTKSGGTEQTLGNWNDVSKMQSAKLAVSTGEWSFTLTAKAGEENGTTLSGTTSKQIELGDNALSFALSISDDGAGVGTFSITLNYAGAENADKVDYISARLETIAATPVSIIDPRQLAPSSNTVNFEASNIPAGTYRAFVIFYATRNGTRFEIATYRELVQISSGLTSSATRQIESFDNLYTITYHLNGGSLAAGVTLPETFTRKSSITLPAGNSITRNYYDFDGWYTDQNCTAGNEISTILNITTNLDLYARFVPINYQIIYNFNGGANPVGTFESYTIEDDITLPEPIFGENAFIGWFENEDFSGDIFSGWKAGDYHKTLTFYAKWDGIKADPNDIVTKIKSMTESETIRAKGEFSIETIKEINIALKELAANSPNVLISLDLSKVTGLEMLISASSSNSNNSFYKCTNLKAIQLPETLQDIRDDAFYGCSELSYISIPSSVRRFYSRAFDYCNKLKEVNYEGTIEQWCCIGFMNYYSNPCSNGADLSINGLKLTEVQIPDTISIINQNTFSGCHSITKVIIPNSVVEIEYGVFLGCDALEEITIPFVGKSIDATEPSESTLFGYIFDDYKPNNNLQLTAVNQEYSNSPSRRIVYYIPTSLRKVTVTGGDLLYGAFYDCEMIKEVVLEEGISSIGYAAFSDCTGLTNITIPEGVTSVGTWAFSYCKSLKEVTIPDSVISLSWPMFHNSFALEKITVPFVGTSINEPIMFRKFFNDGVQSALKQVTITSGKLIDNAFSECPEIETIIIGAQVTHIGKGAFTDCTNLNSVSVESPNNWYYTSDSNYINGTACNFSSTDTEQNATLLKETYKNYYLYRE